MKISGFTFIRNGIKYGYPFCEAIQSILPICDELVVAVGNSEDGTRDAIVNLNSTKIKIIDTVWDESLREGGRILAQQTDIAFDHITGDWGFCIQGDECVHEKYLSVIREAMEKNLDDKKVDGLLFNYLHFYGSYDYVATSRDWYRKEIRVVRNDKSIRSWKDAQGFRKNVNGEMVKLNVKQIDAWIYHYGWVRPPKVMQDKQKYFHSLWHSDEKVKKIVGAATEFDFSKIDVLEKFDGTHPVVMKDYLEKMRWDFSLDKAKMKSSMRKKILHFVEKQTGWRAGEYKNYKLIR